MMRRSTVTTAAADALLLDTGVHLARDVADLAVFGQHDGGEERACGHPR